MIPLHGHLSSYENSSPRERGLLFWILRKKKIFFNSKPRRWGMRFLPTSQCERPGLSICRWAFMCGVGWLKLYTTVPCAGSWCPFLPLLFKNQLHLSPSFLFHTGPINVLQSSRNVSHWVLTPKINGSHTALYFPPVTCKVIAKVSSCACPLVSICLLVFKPRGFSFFSGQLCFKGMFVIFFCLEGESFSL